MTSEIGVKEPEKRGNPNWFKGMKSPNPSGESVAIRKLRRLLAKHSNRAVQVAVELMEQSQDEHVRLKAVDIILKYGVPKQKETHDVNVKQSAVTLPPGLAAKLAAMDWDS